MGQATALADWRIEQNLTQAEAAEKIGVSRAAWQAWEGGVPPGLGNALALEKLTEGAVTAAEWVKPRRKGRRVRHRSAA
jgi:transcriptional regulator with XRE-family HTH domain